MPPPVAPLTGLARHHTDDRRKAKPDWRRRQPRGCPRPRGLRSVDWRLSPRQNQPVPPRDRSPGSRPPRPPPEAVRRAGRPNVAGKSSSCHPHVVTMSSSCRPRVIIFGRLFCYNPLI
uniref:Uncharacterized protein n=1 Tax=uncultured marine microorganism HF4000_APKG2J17 TaxID=455546 RepID=B3T6J1_9ZZZZ|nr:hypothetical protein ALOHA_HF4000APKG2J17ctg1g7 [uncultured marine microorganism HF4000_APKG2J17]